MAAMRDLARPVSSPDRRSGRRDIDVAGRGRRDHHPPVRGRTPGHRRPHHAAEPRDHPPPRRRGRHPRTDDPAPGRGPHPDPGARHRIGGRAEGADRHHRAADLPPGRRTHRETPTTDPGGAQRSSCPRSTRRASSTSSNRPPSSRGEDLVDAQPAFDQNGRPAVNFRFNPTGARKFGDYTAENIGSPFAIVLDDEVISAPVIQSHIPGGSGIITGKLHASRNRPSWRSCCARARCRRSWSSWKNAPSARNWAQDSIDAGQHRVHRRLRRGAGLHGR